MVVKLNIKPLTTSLAQKYANGIDVLFNPNSYTISKSVSWLPVARAPAEGASTGTATAGGHRDLDAPPLDFGGGGSRTLTLRLFFDVTERGPDADVRSETDKLVELTRIQPTEGQKRAKPPVCQILWGGQASQKSDFPFTGVATQLTQNFVLFRNSGQPVRANVDITFLEHIDPPTNKKETDPDFTTYVVRRGDTLAAISARLYRDPALWRVIATANSIDDPRRLTIGARLSIPALTLPR